MKIGVQHYFKMIIYETPTKEYQIRKQTNMEWAVVFGEELVVYNICKYNQSLSDWNKKNPEAKLSDFIIVRSEERLKDAFEWLRKNNIISNDEMKQQILEKL